MQHKITSKIASATVTNQLDPYVLSECDDEDVATNPQHKKQYEDGAFGSFLKISVWFIVFAEFRNGV
ncbi:hypothetical protein AC249_AIPGENE4198 [Exaiptasia diaphana]|nr:hypothetical protein AC249_AIPGENE4198 [Exaiptasia diaphana]